MCKPVKLKACGCSTISVSPRRALYTHSRAGVRRAGGRYLSRETRAAARGCRRVDGLRVRFELR